MQNDGSNKLNELGIYPKDKTNPYLSEINREDFFELCSHFEDLPELINAIEDALPFEQSGIVRLKFDFGKVLDGLYVAMLALSFLPPVAVLIAILEDPEFVTNVLAKNRTAIVVFIVILFLNGYIANSLLAEGFPNVTQEVAYRILRGHFRRRSAHALVSTDKPEERQEP